MIPGRKRNLLRINKINNVLETSENKNFKILKDKKKYATLSNKEWIEIEIKQRVEKLIFDYLCDSKDIIEKYVKDLKNISRNKNIITNGALSAVFMDFSKYKFENVKKNKNTHGLFYDAGKINNSKIIVNPYMRWDDHTVLIYDDMSFWDYTYKINEKQKKFNIKVFVDKKILNTVKIYEIKDVDFFI